MVTTTDQLSILLRDLSVPIHRIGFRELCIAIPQFAQDSTQLLSKDLYPYVASHFTHGDPRTIERSIRCAILDAWLNRDPQIWEHYFPRLTKAPSNKLFIATLAEYIK